MSFPTTDLLSSSIFRRISEDPTTAERIELSHERAKAVGLRYALTLEDVLGPSQKFWNMHRDYISTLDGAATALWSIQLNLVAGTLAPFVRIRQELRPLLDDILAFRVSAQFLLTELGHGLDAAHLQTTCTVREDGYFDLHTTDDQAAKYMPPTLPFGGVPRIGLVFARLIMHGEDIGIRPFIVPLNDGKTMCTGVIARQLPSRVGSNDFGHALTYFKHVILPPSALLGSVQKEPDQKKHFLRMLWRVGVGSMSLSTTVVPILKMTAYIAAKYSQRRHVTGPSGQLVPILSFRTQQLPILHSLAQGFVLDALYEQATQWFTSIPNDNIDQRNAISTIVKATMLGHWRRTGCTVADRCGAQGLFAFNQLLPSEMELRGAAIAEGDVLALSIRLAPELLLKRYPVPVCEHMSSLLGRHEQEIFEEMRAMLMHSGHNHRVGLFNRLLLPRCLPMVESIGHRMAWEAALKRGVPEPLVRLYEIGAIGTDLAWYVEHGHLTRDAFFRREDKALSDVYEHLQEYLDATNAAPYAVAAMISDTAWNGLVDSLKVYDGNASYDPLHRARL